MRATSAEQVDELGIRRLEEILGLLSVRDLRRLAKAVGPQVKRFRTRDALLSALLRVKRPVDALLSHLSVSTLKNLCIRLMVDDSAQSRADLIKALTGARQLALFPLVSGRRLPTEQAAEARPTSLDSEYLQVAYRAIRLERRPLTSRELVDIALRERMFSDRIAGRTPERTMNAKISVHIRVHADASPFVRTEPGRFYLRELLKSTDSIYDAPRLVPPPYSEDVLVFPAGVLNELGRFQGIKKEWKSFARRLLGSALCTYIPRLVAEQNDEFKQVLTYVLVTSEGRVLAYRRGNYTRIEDSLKGCECVGFGGHVSSQDRHLFAARDLGVSECAVRELGEELMLPQSDARRLREGNGLKCIGLLNDDSSAVGRRHFAFVYQYEVSSGDEWSNPERGEKSITRLRWIDPTLNSPPLAQFEYWSQLCLREFFDDANSARPSYLLRRRSVFRRPDVVCVIGEIGSGKSEATKILVEDLGYVEVNSGRVVAKLLGIPPVPTTPRAEFQKLAWKFISKRGGPKRLAKELWREINSCRAPAVLDGIRQPATLNALRTLGSSQRLAVLYVHTPPDLCYAFYRKRTGKSLTIQDFLALRDAPVEQDVRSLIGRADAILYNWTGKLKFRAVIRQLMGEAGGVD